MIVITTFVKRHPLPAFFGLAFILSVAATPLTFVAPELPPFVLVFLPALTAIVITSLMEGRPGVNLLLKRLTIWRVNPVWYGVVFGFPLVVGATVVELAVWLGSSTAAQIGTLSIFSLMFFVFAIGEELGWRGFALPKLLARYSALTASLLFGLFWAAFHLPLFLPGQFFAHDPPVATALVFVANAVLYTWIFQHTQGSVFMATLFHGAINASAIFTAGMDPAQARWLQAATWSVIAVIVVVMSKSMWYAPSSTQDKHGM